MKLNKILNVIFAIALFAAFIGAVETLYNGAEMLGYTSFYKDNYLVGNKFDYNVTDSYYNFQKPIGIILLIASLIGILGVAAGVVFIAINNKVAKSVSLAVMCVALLTFVASIIVTYCIWLNAYDAEMFTTRVSNFREIKEKIRFPMIISSAVATELTLYSASMALFVQNLVYHFVIVAIAVYELVKYFMGNKKTKTEIATPVETNVTAEQVTQVNNTEEI